MFPFQYLDMLCFNQVGCHRRWCSNWSRSSWLQWLGCANGQNAEQRIWIHTKLQSLFGHISVLACCLRCIVVRCDLCWVCEDTVSTILLKWAWHFRWGWSVKNLSKLQQSQTDCLAGSLQEGPWKHASKASSRGKASRLASSPESWQRKPFPYQVVVISFSLELRWLANCPDARMQYRAPLYHWYLLILSSEESKVYCLVPQRVPGLGQGDYLWQHHQGLLRAYKGVGTLDASINLVGDLHILIVEALNGLVADAWDLAILPVFAGFCPHNGFKKEQAASLSESNVSCRRSLKIMKFRSRVHAWVLYHKDLSHQKLFC